MAKKPTLKIIEEPFKMIVGVIESCSTPNSIYRGYKPNIGHFFEIPKGTEIYASNHNYMLPIVEFDLSESGTPMMLKIEDEIYRVAAEQYGEDWTGKGLQRLSSTWSRLDSFELADLRRNGSKFPESWLPLDNDSPI